MAHKINLKAIYSGKESYNYHVDSEFFSGREHSLIDKGDLDVCAETVRDADTDGFLVHLSMKGNVVVPCDLCLGDLCCPVDVENDIKVKLGKDGDDNGEFLLADAETGTLDLDQLVYDYTVLAIPLHPKHAEGDCDETMIKKLDEYLVH